MSQPLVSIIIPTFNRELYIASALDSILRQTYSQWECWVVDDGSTDGTELILQDYAHRDKRIHYVKRPNHYAKGANGSRNYGYALSQGTFIAFCDDDDFWLDDKLEKQIQVFRDHPEVGLVTGNIEYVNEDGVRTGRVIKQKRNHGHVFKDLWFKNGLSMITPVLKREVFDKVGLFNPNFAIFEDWEFWRRVAYYYPFYALDEVLACVRIHELNTSKIVTTQPLEQYIRYTELNKATWLWGKAIFTKTDKQMMHRMTWKRYRQIMKNHCPGVFGKLKLFFGIINYNIKDAFHFVYLFLRYELYKK